MSDNLQKEITKIRIKRNFSPTDKQGAVMLKCHATLDFDTLLEGIDVYYPQNAKHFWLGIATEPHITLHHGFNLQRYEEDGSGKQGWTDDINSILDALDQDDAVKNPDRKDTFRERLFKTEMTAKPSFFPPNPALLTAGEENYFSIVLAAEPTPELITFRQALMKVFPHTSQFPDWKVHTSVVSVANEKSRDMILSRLEHSCLRMYELMIGYNINK